MTQKKYKKGDGFTLIELLVVISIISSLSAVVLSSVNSARKKAENSTNNRVAEEYIQALTLAYDADGQYPNPGNTTTTYCLGDYPTIGVYTSPSVCGYVSGADSENSTILVGPAGDGGVARFLPSLPVMKIVTASNNNFSFRGPVYRCSNISNGLCIEADVAWHLKSHGQTCIRDAEPSDIFSGNTQCVVTLK